MLKINCYVFIRVKTLEFSANHSKHGGALDVSTPHLIVPFKKGLNVLIGENDSGKQLSLMQ